MTVSPAARQSADDQTLVLVLAAAAVAVSLPGCLLAAVLARSLRGHRGWLFLLALAGAGATVFTYPGVLEHMTRALASLRASSGADLKSRASLMWPHVRSWWLDATPLAPVFALFLEALRPKQVAELHQARDERERRRQRRRERRARNEPLAFPSRRSRRARGFVLGRHIDGDRLLPVLHRRVRMPEARLRRLTVVVGAPGSGKTETLLRLAQGAASLEGWSVFMIDPKGDSGTMERFAALMASEGRTPTLFPATAYDGWRGTGASIANRLMEMVDWAEEGGGAYYRDLSVNLVRLACTAPDGPPRSARELLGRLDRDRLADLWAGTSQLDRLAGFKDDDIASCRHRYQAFFDAIGTRLDGSFAFEDGDCAYLLLDELSYYEETSKLARFLFADFKQYVGARKQAGHKVLLIVDEFSAVASGERIARLTEIVRSYGGSLVLAPQSFEGMGGPEPAARILSAAHTTLLHALPAPEPFVHAAGTTIGIETSIQHDGGLSLDIGTTREQHQHRVSPNDVRALAPGMCFAIGSGQAQKIQVLPTPEHPGPPPSREDLNSSCPTPVEREDLPLRL